MIEVQKIYNLRQKDHVGVITSIRDLEGIRYPAIGYIINLKLGKNIGTGRWNLEGRDDEADPEGIWDITTFYGDSKTHPEYFL